MGLEGTLRDFPLTEILQLLGAQRKTGVLTVEAVEDTITVSFEGGQVVRADSENSSFEERVGGLLVRAGKLDSGQLLRALESRKTTHEPLPALLLKDRSVSAEDLSEAIRIQVFRIVLPAFRWKDGKFRFNPSAVRGDGALLALPTESLLNESARLLEQWPDLETKIPSRELVLARAPGVETLRLVLAPEHSHEGALLVSRREAEAWKWVDGRRSVAEILDRAFLPDLEIYQGLKDLFDRNLIVAVGVESAPRAGKGRRPFWLSVRALGLWVIFLLLAASAVREVPRGKWNYLLLPPGKRAEATGILASVSLSRMARLERAIRTFYHASGQYPRTLQDLLDVRILSREATIDPYGRPYRYILRSQDGKFSLYGRNVTGGIDLRLSFERSLAPVGGPGSTPAARPVEARPGIEVIQ